MPLDANRQGPEADRGVDRPTRRIGSRLAMVLAAVSFVIYAVTALLVYQQLPSSHGVERYSIAAAVSTLGYGAPVGAMYTGVLTELINAPGPQLADTLSTLARGDTARGDLIAVNHDGNGIGYPVFATVAMALFGIRLDALCYGFFSFVGISTLAFILRYQDARLLIVPMAFAVMTAMLFTPLAQLQTVLDASFLGGIRYFSLAGILPALHLMLELADPAQPNRRRFAGNLGLAAIQLFALFIAILVRGSPGYSLIGLGVFCVILLFRRRHDGAAVRRLALNAGGLLLIGAAMTSAIYACVPASYKETGRTTGIVWHRMVVSLSLNPDWPFGDLNETHNCRQYIPKGLAAENGDQIGHCLWIVYAAENGMSLQQIVDGVYDRQYESVMRADFIHILLSYPNQTISTFFINKIELILDSIKIILKISGSITNNFYISSLLIELMIVFLIWRLTQQQKIEQAIEDIWLPATILSVLSFALPIVAWGRPDTMWDNVFYLFFDSALVAGAVVPMLKPRSLRRGYDTILRLLGVEAS